MDAQWWLEFFLISMRASTPLIFAALGVLIAERAGVLHIGVEGCMLLGALAAVAGWAMGDTAIAAVGLAVAAGAFAGIVLSFLTVKLPADQIVAGITFNIAMIGVTSVIFRLGDPPTLLRALPPFLFGLTSFTWFALILTVAVWFLLFRSAPGLMLRSAGQNALGAHSAGINIVRVRIISLIIAAILSAIGGAALSVGWVAGFSDNMTLGRGFIALAAVYFGRWHPALALSACILFGAGEALAFRAQGGGLNPHYYLMLPYLLTLVGLGLMGRSMQPREAGRPYIRR